MDNCIIVNLTMFSVKQPILIQKDGETSVQSCTIDQIPEVVLELCKEYGINEVKLNGHSSYGEGIANQINISEKILYSENKINVEVL